MAIDASMPAAFRGLFEPHRYKVFYGGRGGSPGPSPGRCC